ncbi:hypothetical protein VNO77_14907 [Canavalia gladiata]|uniref:Uncharacterized protein n=1 Tax=Canavalia gladiata TaxID=3824 RepID=A0AAN9LZ29_CANGL
MSLKLVTAAKCIVSSDICRSLAQKQLGYILRDYHSFYLVFQNPVKVARLTAESGLHNPGTKQKSRCETAEQIPRSYTTLEYTLTSLGHMSWIKDKPKLFHDMQSQFRVA